MIENYFSLKNKSAIVTGALGLLGMQHCFALKEAGASVIVCDQDENKCRQFANELGNNSMGIGVDITGYSSVKNLLKTVQAHFESVDILVNNAAINDKFEDADSAIELSKFENYPLELWESSLKVNVTGMFICCQVIGSEMAGRKSGSIINIASTYGIVAPDQSLYRDKEGVQHFYKTASYPAAKGAVISFTKFLASYWGNKGVRVNVLSPGGVENFQDQFFVENYSSRTPLGRMAKSCDYKGSLIFLASDASSYMTGANLVVDGGFTIW
ncbi:MAG: SDR family oxidoreductase [Ignavibacteriaceae bacterium]|jgi:NAD(P)-dependent dehydrogenase (short-subunit alcohol dehydrogenase family)